MWKVISKMTFRDNYLYSCVWKYQPSGKGGTRSMPATPNHCPYCCLLNYLGVIHLLHQPLCGEGGGQLNSDILDEIRKEKKWFKSWNKLIKYFFTYFVPSTQQPCLQKYWVVTTKETFVGKSDTNWERGGKVGCIKTWHLLRGRGGEIEKYQK